MKKMATYSMPNCTGKCLTSHDVHQNSFQTAHNLIHILIPETIFSIGKIDHTLNLINIFGKRDIFPFLKYEDFIVQSLRVKPTNTLPLGYLQKEL